MLRKFTSHSGHLAMFVDTLNPPSGVTFTIVDAAVLLNTNLLWVWLMLTTDESQLMLKVKSWQTVLVPL